MGEESDFHVHRALATWAYFAGSNRPVTRGGGAHQCLAIELQVRAVEEPYLEHTHGVTYRTYGSRVGRFLPGLGLFRTGEQQSSAQEPHRNG